MSKNMKDPSRTDTSRCTVRKSGALTFVLFHSVRTESSYATAVTCSTKPRVHTFLRGAGTCASASPCLSAMDKYSDRQFNSWMGCFV